MSSIVFYYALCLLYALSTATVVSDLVTLILGVSNNFICKNIFFFTCCAVAYQYATASTSNWLMAKVFSHFDGPNHSKWLLWFHCPMYHSTHKSLYLSSVLYTWIFKDLPLLDCVGPRYPRRDHSFILGNHILRLVNLFHLISQFQFIASTSYLDKDSWRKLRYNIGTRRIIDYYLGEHGDSNRLRRVHGREYPGDGLDRVQDPQGVLGS